VTRWSKLATSWEGVSLDTLLAEVETGAGYASVDSYGGYIANLRWGTCSTARAWVAFGVR
jgi:DMSO/TMAO reductase YedYZ molybdopterin-dependent catalytic subunit